MSWICFAQRGELRLLVVELFCIALQERFFFGAAAQRFHIFAQAALIVDDAVNILLAIFHFLLEFLYNGLLRCDCLQSRGRLRSERAIFQEQLNLIRSEIGNLIDCGNGPHLLDR